MRISQTFVITGKRFIIPNRVHIERHKSALSLLTAAVSPANYSLARITFRNSFVIAAASRDTHRLRDPEVLIPE